MRKILCLVIISLFCLSSILPVVNSINIEKNTDTFENSLDIVLQLPSSNRWIKTFGGSGWDEGRSVLQTSDGCYIILGRTSYGAGGGDVWLIKTDVYGNELWNRSFGGSKEEYGYSVKQTLDGCYIIAASTMSFGAGDYDVWLIKTDDDGNKIWDKTFGGINVDKGTFVQQTTDGGYILTGYTESFSDNESDIWLIKTDSYGNEEWNRTFGGIDSDLGWAVQQTTDNGYIIMGLLLRRALIILRNTSNNISAMGSNSSSFS